MRRFLLVGGPYNMQPVRVREGQEAGDEFRPPVPGYNGYYKNNGNMSPYDGIAQLEWVEEDDVVEHEVVDNSELTEEELANLRQTPKTTQFAERNEATSDRGDAVTLDDVGVKRG